MTTDDNEMPEYIGTIKTEYYKAYFGNNQSYYLPVMIDFDKGKKFSFNLWSFLGGLFWQLYRRLYMAMLLFFAFILVESIIQQQVLSDTGMVENGNVLINFILTLIFGVIYGYTGNYFLMRKTKEKIINILEMETDEDIILQNSKRPARETG